MTSLRLFALLGLTALVLAACSDVRESLGLGRSPPDEFAVADRPPLSMPPDFGLRPPKPGAPRPQEADTTKKASDVLFASNSQPADTEASDAEKALLTETGATKADPNIRQVIDRENSERVVGSKHLLQELLWWKNDAQPGTAVDATAEAARIKEAKEKGEPLNQGATPVIERQKGGWLGL